ncbi:MAG TPA: gamma-glutamyltransferase [Longimicrobiales bacterium]|nr:gamma-glutamyltransferase [Longimicrobiales bacterium]
MIRSISLLVLAVFVACGPSAPPETVTASASAETAARGQEAMVVSAHLIASQVGEEIMRKGGNAVDAAVATGFALAVVYPSAGNIGGGGFMVIRFPDGEATAINFREKAPLAAHPEMWLDENGEYDYQRHHLSHVAVGVPGTVAGFAMAHQKYGSLPWEDLVEPAVRLAEDGFEVTPGLARSLENILPDFEPYPASVAAYSKDGVPYEVGDTMRLPDLAASLARIRDNGRDGFYQGETARLLVEEMERGGGIITQEDLDRYEAEEREPIRGTYRGYGIIGMPPPSSGGVGLVEMLNILEGFELGSMEHNSGEYIHHMVEAMRRSYLDRARHIADPNFSDVPVERLTSKEYAAELRETIDPNQATPSELADIEVPAESEQTTHYSVMDGDGMAVSTTYTLEHSYGSRIVVTGGGFLLNNEMGDFNAAPGLTTDGGLVGTEPNLARPEQRMLSSMTPTILEDPDGELYAVVGTVGGRTIINLVLQVTVNLLDFGMEPMQAVSQPRFHHQWMPDRIRLERDFEGTPVLEELDEMGHEYFFRSPWGGTHTIVVGEDGTRLGAPDPRNTDGGAVGH